MTRATAPASWLRRLSWMILLWAASVIALGAVATVVRLFLNAAGMTA